MKTSHYIFNAKGQDAQVNLEIKGEKKSRFPSRERQ